MCGICEILKDKIVDFGHIFFAKMILELKFPSIFFLSNEIQTMNFNVLNLNEI